MTTATLDAPATAGAVLLELDLAEVHESPLNPRKHYDAEPLQQLADNMKTAGQITPVVVRPRPQGGYELAAGHRRSRAAKLAGLPTLLAIVREMDDAQFVEILNIENLQRDDLNALEEAEGFAQLMTLAGYDVPKIAERVGRSVKYVYDRLKLRSLIPAAKKLLLAGTITPGHGILLARLSKDDQERALSLDGDDNWRRNSGVLQREDVSESYTLFHGESPEERAQRGTLAKVLDDASEPVKARSVRELQQWIDRNVRFVPDQVNQADLAFDLPKTAELLAARANDKLKVVKITREYRVPDEARHESERTYGINGWERADGEPEPVGPYGEEKNPKPSKTCEYSRVGLVVAGPGRGEAFLVCVNKEKCATHWAEEMKRRAQRAKERERSAGKNGAAAPTAKEAKVDPTVLPAELRETWEQEELTARLPDVVKGVKAVIAELKISDEICWNITGGDFYLNNWNKVGKRGWSGRLHMSRGTNHQDDLEQVVAKELPGKFTSGSMQAEDGPGARSELAWNIWLARDCAGMDESIEKAVEARWTAHRKAAQKEAKPVQTSGKAKKRAGDVARAKKKKAAKR